MGDIEIATVAECEEYLEKLMQGEEALLPKWDYSGTNAQKDTRGKVRLDLIPYNALEAVARVREFGSLKYGAEWEWRKGNENDFVTASLRHIHKHLDATNNEYSKHEKYDDESGLPHLYHAACSLLMAIDIIANKGGNNVE